MRFSLIVLICFFFVTPDLLAQSNTSSVYRFLQVTPSAKVAAQGGNHVGLFDANSGVLFLNPAYLDESSQHHINATFVNYLADARYGFVNYALHAPKVGTIGVGIRFAGYGDLTEYDVDGNSMGALNANDLALTSALSTQLSPKLRAGASVDFVHSSYGDFNSSALMGSAGLYYLDVDARFSAGISVRNLGDQINYYNDTREELPFDVSVGFSKKPDRFPFQLSLTLQQLNNWELDVPGDQSDETIVDNLYRHVILGAEATLSRQFFLRFGYNRWQHELVRTNENFDFAGASMGVGIYTRNIEIDISRNSLSNLGGVVQLSVRTKTH
ncbi:MAG: type IX secretion system protein PorQ [Balneolaceae bacterium]|nr:type IX secretion system protein PorQ [Balneolaceae bacterium]